MKILLIILDGGGDVGERTPYQIANKPNIDSLAKNGICGLLDIGYKGTPQSDFGYLNILGFYSDNSYPGRGYLEALGLGMEDIEESDICIRGNFATLADNGNILDRRAGRDETGLEELTDMLDGMEIDGVHFSLKKSAGHRVVIILKPLDGNVKLSDQVISNDPEKTGMPVMQIKSRNPEAKFTASVLNKFVSKTNKLLSNEQVNRERKLPANVLLLRGFGRKEEIETFEKKYGMSSCCIAGIPVVKGVASFLGMDIITVPGATGYPDTNLEGKFRETFKSLQKYDFVWLHINGTDILSHDKKREEKAKFIEKIDKNLGEILKKIDMKETIVIITSDHRTASDPSYPYYRHTRDPNPILISGDGIKPDRIGKFEERSCTGGFYIKGNGLLPFLLKEVK
ncbi:MAG: 2,3-bisphosphoglycerate-independent phosphoglycerate mutase [Candidatus Aenigmarchaeota archaeon]|nr:2,3-bisphosphoglycerate-independent phosphoglycerate mutase [Candidatus Aenigmarchaeota archaeon]